MKTITVNVEEDVEKRFRRLASAIYGKRKGYLGKALTEAMKEWEKRRVKMNHVAKAMLLLEKGIKMRRWRFKREDLHER